MLQRLVQLPLGERQEALLRCCASARWSAGVAERLPMCRTVDDVLGAADRVWWGLGPDDWREALNAHPKIGERTAAGSQESREQSSMADAGPAVQEAIAGGNRLYEQRFRMTYVVRAAGRTPAEMLLLLRQRLDNDPDSELRVAAAEQSDITRLRLLALLGQEGT